MNRLDRFLPPTAPSPAVRRIVHAAAAYYFVGLRDVRGPRRLMRIVEPRQVACLIARRLTSASYEVIGQHIGWRDHTTVMHGEREILRRMEHDATLRARVAELTEKCRGELVAHHAAQIDALGGNAKEAV